MPTAERASALRPPLKWAGGKRWQVPHLQPLWEPHSRRRLVEPFCGGLAVTLRLRIRSASLGTDAFTHTFSAVREGSHWAWILTPDRYELYRSDACG